MTIPDGANMDSEYLDMERLNELNNTLSEEIASIMSELRNAAPRVLESMVSALQHSDPAMLIPPTHALRGMAGNTGLIRLEKECARLESRLRNNEVPDVRHAVSEIAITLGASLSALSLHGY